MLDFATIEFHDVVDIMALRFLAGGWNRATFVGMRTLVLKMYN